MNQPRFARTPTDAQRAHDLLVSVLTNKLISDKLDPETTIALMVATDVLCWLLGHEHNATFARNLEMVEEIMKSAGYGLIDTGELHPGGNGRPQ